MKNSVVKACRLDFGAVAEVQIEEAPNFRETAGPKDNNAVLEANEARDEIVAKTFDGVQIDATKSYGVVDDLGRFVGEDAQEASIRVVAKKMKGDAAINEEIEGVEMETPKGFAAVNDEDGVVEKKTADAVEEIEVVQPVTVNNKISVKIHKEGNLPCFWQRSHCVMMENVEAKVADDAEKTFDGVLEDLSVHGAKRSSDLVKKSVLPHLEWCSPCKLVEEEEAQIAQKEKLMFLQNERSNLPQNERQIDADEKEIKDKILDADTSTVQDFFKVQINEYTAVDAVGAVKGHKFATRQGDDINAVEDIGCNNVDLDVDAMLSGGPTNIANYAQVNKSEGIVKEYDVKHLENAEDNEVKIEISISKNEEDEIIKAFLGAVCDVTKVNSELLDICSISDSQDGTIQGGMPRSPELVVNEMEDLDRGGFEVMEEVYAAEMKFNTHNEMQLMKVEHVISAKSKDVSAITVHDSYCSREVEVPYMSNLECMKREERKYEGQHMMSRIKPKNHKKQLIDSLRSITILFEKMQAWEDTWAFPILIVLLGFIADHMKKILSGWIIKKSISGAVLGSPDYESEGPTYSEADSTTCEKGLCP